MLGAIGHFGLGPYRYLSSTFAGCVNTCLQGGHGVVRSHKRGDAIGHEFVVMKGKFAELPKASNGAVDETKLAAGALIGRTPSISPQNSTTATHTLDPGNYVLLCNTSVGPNSRTDGQRLDVTAE